jgi:ElaB/YqjD/DUF883 family membrane-anchored ribosome-binding protein
LLKATADDVSGKAKEARERLGAALERAKATCHDVQEQTIEKVKTAAKTTDTVIRDHPYESIGVALGVGVLVGLIIGRK